MQDLDDFIRACRGHADREYALPDLVDVTHHILEADFECGCSPEQAVNAIARKLDLVGTKDWDLAKATALMARVSQQPVITLKRRSA